MIYSDRAFSAQPTYSILNSIFAYYCFSPPDSDILQGILSFFKAPYEHSPPAETEQWLRLHQKHVGGTRDQLNLSSEEDKNEVTKLGAGKKKCETFHENNNLGALAMFLTALSLESRTVSVTRIHMLAK